VVRRPPPPTLPKSILRGLVVPTPEDVSGRTRVEREMLPVSAATPIWPNLWNRLDLACLG